uniref:Putative disease resistance protein n=1 Tax=Noccaea caerulescens TaxID=107243 RepID=A0A1J3HSB3_NOCCA
MDRIQNQMASSSSHRQRIHAVFISFRGEDTRKTFVSHLDKALCTRGIATFKDNRKLEVGDSIPDKLSGAIRASRFAVVVISEKYATSSWCLDELQLIMEEEIEVFPIFYGVKPSQVRHQLGDFSLERYRDSEMANKVPGWRKALTGIGNRKGKESTQCVDDATMIEEIVQRISSRLLSILPIDFGDTVGMEAHMEALSSLLDMGSKDEARIIGISGTGGIGKTTIAKYLYEHLKLRFSPHHCFLESVSKLCGEHGLVYLQQQLLSNIFHEENVKLGSVEHGRQQLEFRIRDVKVFLVLDDVDDAKQLRALAKDIRWFGAGSRIIITTRDKSLLNSCGGVYDVKCLDDDKALQLFQRIAFEGDQPPSSDYYKDLSRRVTRLAQGLPLALQAFGFYLKRMPLVKWERALVSFKNAPDGNIRRILDISCDSLDGVSKSALLHVTCLLNGGPVWCFKAPLDRVEDGLKVLAEKSLINISTDGLISMHRLLEGKGSYIVDQESGNQPEILFHGNIYQVLADKTGTTSIEGVVRDVSELPYDVNIEWELFKSMENLDFLKICNYKRCKALDSRSNCNLKGISLPCKLRVLHWDAYPFTALPSIVHHDCLVELDLCYSKLTTLWSGNPPRLAHLKRLYLTGSKDLKELPDLQEAVSLEELMLEGCVSLTRIPESICSLPRLQKVDLSNCDGLKNLRIIIGESEATFFLGTSLRVKSVLVDFLDAEPLVKESQGISLMNLSIKGNLEIKLKLLGGFAEHLCFITEQQIPHRLMMLEQQTDRPKTPSYGFKSLDIVRFNYNNKENGSFKCCGFLDFPWLTELNLINLNIEKIPDDIHHMRVLEKLDLSGNGFSSLPSSMMLLSKLKHVTLCNCRMLEALPELYQLERLALSDCTNLRKLTNLPQAEQDQGSYSLLELLLDNCNSVESLSDELSHFTKLTYLDISRHDFETVPTSIMDLSSLVTLCLNYCKQLKSLTELPLSVKYLYAHGCKSLEKFSFSIDHSVRHLDLSPCFHWNQAYSQITRFPVGRHCEEVSVCACFQKSNQGTRRSLRSIPMRRFDFKTLKLMALAVCTGVLISCRQRATATK